MRPWAVSAFPSDRHRSEIVRRLRAAGCVFAEDEARLLIDEAETSSDLHHSVDRRVAGLPLEHVLGWAEFCGLRIAVDAAVFVPRRRTELLVRQAAAVARRAASAASEVAARPPVVVDLCCGSGAVGAALVAALHEVELYAVDIDPAAVQCAARNLAATIGQVYLGDLYEALPATLRGRVDIIVANAPYVPTDAVGLMPPEARVHEPRVALDGGPDGLDVQRRVITGARPWLSSRGRLLVETSRPQAPHTFEAFVRSGLRARVARSDELDATVVVSTGPAWA